MLLLLSLSFDITGILTCSFKKSVLWSLGASCHLTNQIVCLSIFSAANRNFCDDGDVLYLCHPI